MVGLIIAMLDANDKFIVVSLNSCCNIATTVELAYLIYRLSSMAFSLLPLLSFWLTCFLALCNGLLSGGVYANAFYAINKEDSQQD